MKYTYFEDNQNGKCDFEEMTLAMSGKARVLVKVIPKRREREIPKLERDRPRTKVRPRDTDPRSRDSHRPQTRLFRNIVIGLYRSKQRDIAGDDN